jgi:inosose dehydratase
MRMPIGNGPVSWGVDFADQPDIPAWETVFEQIAQAGYTWAEVGPLGYLPNDSDLVRSRFDAWGLSVAGSFVFEPLHDATAFADVLWTAERACARISELGGRFLVIIDRVSDERAATAGDFAHAVRADARTFAHLVTAIDAVADVAVAHGLTPVLHPHVGSYIEFADEIEAVLSAVSSADLGLCIDTGHAAYAGIDPAVLAIRYASRVRYVHFKDVDRNLRGQVVADRTPFFEALAQGIFCAIGDGGVDFAAFVTALDSIGYEGPGTVEQDRRPETPGDPFIMAVTSLAYLRGAGIEPVAS